MKKVRASSRSEQPVVATATDPASLPDTRGGRGKPILLAQASLPTSSENAAPPHRYMARLDEGRDLLRNVYGKRDAASETPDEQKPVSVKKPNLERAVESNEAPQQTTTKPGASNGDLPPELVALMGEKTPAAPSEPQRAPATFAHATPKPQAEVARTPAASKPAARTVKPETATPPLQTWSPGEPVRPLPGSPASRYDWSNHGGS